jgi:signal transduction histidine kinase
VFADATRAGDELGFRATEDFAGGMAELSPNRERIFGPFYRADPSCRDTGAGLGLAISRAIVEAHGGRNRLEDASVGTRVRFRLLGVV